jgi:hypothetical protein
VLRSAGERPRRSDVSYALFREVVHRAALPWETLAMMIRSGGFYHDDEPTAPQPRDAGALAILLIIVAAVGAAIAVLAWALLLTTGR